MAETTRITVTLPNDQVAELKKLTDNVSAYVAEAVARQIRHELLGAELDRYEEEHGAFTAEEIAEAQARIDAAMNPGTAGTAGTPKAHETRETPEVPDGSVARAA